MTCSKLNIQRENLPFVGGRRAIAQSTYGLLDLFARTPFSPASLERLRQARVAIVGLGSGGGKLAVDLAKAGVGSFTLIDPARLKAHNVPRHVASLQDVGRYKVEAVSDLMQAYNPTVQVDTYTIDWFNPPPDAILDHLLENINLVIAATDRTETQLAINALTWAQGIPTVFGGCYEAARGGEVFFTLPGEGTPCLACLRAGLQAPQPTMPFDYSAARSAQDFQAEPGLGCAVDLITVIEAQISLGLLLRGSDSQLAHLIHPQRNFLLIGGAAAANFYRFKRPFQIFWQPLAGPRPGCPVCQA